MFTNFNKSDGFYKKVISNGSATFSVQFDGGRRCRLSKSTATDQKMKPVVTLLDCVVCIVVREQRKEHPKICAVLVGSTAVTLKSSQ